MGCPLSQIVDAVGGERLYKGLYKPFSEWIHWSPRGISRALISTDNKTDFLPPGYVTAYNSLASGFQCLYETAEFVNKYFSKGMNKKLKGLEKRYYDWGEKTKG